MAENLPIRPQETPSVVRTEATDPDGLYRTFHDEELPTDEALNPALNRSPIQKLSHSH